MWMPRSFSMSIIWKILAGILLSLSLTFIALFQNQVEWIFPAFFSWQHLYAGWWFSWHMLSDMKSLPENLSWRRSSDLFRRFFRSRSTFCWSFLHLNFPTTKSFFIKRWRACKSFSLVSFSVKESAQQMFELFITDRWRDRVYLNGSSSMMLSISNCIPFQLNNSLS